MFDALKFDLGIYEIYEFHFIASLNFVNCGNLLFYLLARRVSAKPSTTSRIFHFDETHLSIAFRHQLKVEKILDVISHLFLELRNATTNLFKLPHIAIYVPAVSFLFNVLYFMRISSLWCSFYLIARIAVLHRLLKSVESVKPVSKSSMKCQNLITAIRWN